MYSFITTIYSERLLTYVLYLGLDVEIKKLSQKGVKLLAYITAHMNIKGSLFLKNQDKDFFMKNDKGEIYLINFGEFLCATVDLTNTDAWTWYKGTLLSVPYLVSHQFPRCRRRIMVSLEYLPYYWKLFNHIWQLYTLDVGKFFHMLKFDLSSLSRSHDEKIVFSGTPARHRSSGKSTDCRGL